MKTQPFLPRLTAALCGIEFANDAFTRAIIEAFTALHEGMKARKLERIELNGRVSFVCEGGDCHDEYVAVTINSDGELVAEDSGGNETPWQSLENDSAHSILCLLEGTEAFCQLIEARPDNMPSISLTESDVNELRFILMNLDSPSRARANALAKEWATKLTLISRKMRPLPTPTVNVN